MAKETDTGNPSTAGMIREGLTAEAQQLLDLEAWIQQHDIPQEHTTGEIEAPITYEIKELIGEIAMASAISTVRMSLESNNPILSDWALRYLLQSAQDVEDFDIDSVFERADQLAVRKINI